MTFVDSMKNMNAPTRGELSITKVPPAWEVIEPIPSLHRAKLKKDEN